jgi:hypothetical protein
VVVHQHHDDLDVLLHRGDKFLGHHQVGPVAHQDEHFAIGVGQLRAQAAGDLIPHAGVAVLDVVALRVPGAPQLMQVTRHGPGGADHHVGRLRGLVDGPDDLGGGRKRLVAERV